MSRRWRCTSGRRGPRGPLLRPAAHAATGRSLARRASGALRARWWSRGMRRWICPHRRVVLEHVPNALSLLDRGSLAAVAVLDANRPGERSRSPAASPKNLVAARRARCPSKARGLVPGGRSPPTEHGWHVALGGGHWRLRRHGDRPLRPNASGEPWGFDCKHAHWKRAHDPRRTRQAGPLVETRYRAAPAGPPEPEVTSAADRGMPLPTPSCWLVAPGHFLADYI